MHLLERNSHMFIYRLSSLVRINRFFFCDHYIYTIESLIQKVIYIQNGKPHFLLIPRRIAIFLVFHRFFVHVFFTCQNPERKQFIKNSCWDFTIAVISEPAPLTDTSQELAVVFIKFTWGTYNIKKHRFQWGLDLFRRQKIYVMVII